MFGKSNYILLDGDSAKWDGSKFMEWVIPSYYFKSLGDEEDIYLSLERCQFLSIATIVNPIYSNCEILTDLELQNQSSSNGTNILDIVDLNVDVTNNIMTPNNTNPIKPHFKVSKFNSIKIAVLHENIYMNLNNVKESVRFYLKVVYV